MPYPLTQALEDNQIDNVLRFLSENPTIINQSLNQNGDTALMIAAKFGYEDLVMLLLKKGSILSHQNAFGESALLLAFESGNQDLLKAIFTLYPELINTVVDSQDNTPLMLATNKGYDHLVQWLLDHEAHVLVQNHLGQYPIAMAGNEQLGSLIQSYTPQSVPASQILSTIKDKIIGRQTTIDYLGDILSTRKAIIYSKMLDFLKAMSRREDLDESNLIDITLMFNGLLLVINAKDEDALKEQLIRLFDARSVMVKGTVYDYNYSAHAFLNKWMHELVDLIWAKELTSNITTHNQILFHGSATQFQGIKQAWIPQDCEYDPFLDADKPAPVLPDDTSILRDKKGRIHETIPLIETLIKQLKKGEVKPENIWLGTDAREAPPKPLSATQIALLTKRSPLLEKLSKYINERYQEYLCKGIRYQFERLRDGLLRGDRTHGGSQEYAGADAAEAQVVFTTWWRDLGKVNLSLQETILSYTLWDKSKRKWISLNDIISPLLDAGKEAERSDESFCVETMGQRLDVFLADRKMQRQMEKDSQLSIEAFDDEILTQYQEKILSQLSESTASMTIQGSNLPFDHNNKLLNWLYLTERAGMPFAYLDIQSIDELSQHQDDMFASAIAALNGAPTLLEKDKENLKTLAIKKDFLPFILTLSDRFSEDDVLTLSYHSLKAYIQKFTRQHQPLFLSTIAYSLKQAIERGDNDWLLFLIQHDLIDSNADCYCMDKRYPELKDEVKVRLASSGECGIDYTVLRRRGNHLLLQFGEAAPEEDVELSLTNKEKVADLRYYNESSQDFSPLIEVERHVDFATYSLMNESLTLFQVLTKEKKVRPDLTVLVDPKSKTFFNPSFARSVLFYLSREKPFELSKDELSELFNAVISAQQFELLKPLVALGLSLDKRVSRMRRYPIDMIKPAQVYNVYYTNKWVKCTVQKIHEKDGVKRALFEPCYNHDASGLLPRWMTLNHYSDLSQLYDPSNNCYLSVREQTQPLPILPFSFKENIKPVWTYLITGNKARDDSLLLEASNAKRIQYIETLSQAGLRLADNCTRILLQQLFKKHPLDQSLLVAIAINNPMVAKQYLNRETLHQAPIEWALYQQADKLIPVLMRWEETIPSGLFKRLYTLSPDMISAFLLGLSQNIEYYNSLLIQGDSWDGLFKAAVKQSLLKRHYLLFERWVQSEAFDANQFAQTISSITFSNNTQIQSVIVFFDTTYPIETVSSSVLTYRNRKTDEGTIKERLAAINRTSSANKKIRCMLADTLLTKLFRDPTHSLALTQDSIEKLVTLIDFDFDVTPKVLYKDVISYVFKHHSDPSCIKPLFDRLDQSIQHQIISNGLMEALWTGSVQQFRNCIFEPDEFISSFIKTYQALYRTQGFFKLANHWGQSKPTLDDIFHYCIHKPFSRSHQALDIVCQAFNGFNSIASESDKMTLFNMIHDKSMAQRWFSRTHLTQDRNYQIVNEYASNHKETRTAVICESLEWGSVYKP